MDSAVLQPASRTSCLIAILAISWRSCLTTSRNTVVCRCPGISVTVYYQFLIPRFSKYECSGVMSKMSSSAKETDTKWYCNKRFQVAPPIRHCKCIYIRRINTYIRTGPNREKNQFVAWSPLRGWSHMVHSPERICKRKPQTLRHVVCMFNGRFTPETNSIVGLLLVCFTCPKKTGPPTAKGIIFWGSAAACLRCDGKYYTGFHWEFNVVSSNGKILLMG